ncbi:outer membrane assembly protein BamC [Enterovibrio norvegicus]|uniref:Outer membrane protein assembly factor BamC n=1 Tax=Enterovibrio norvegicus DSM 15893 TaxID=1121869 RepID=A0A1I5TW84_9GAMM|nr:outer membrane protein assembly factor BamC [Enterovibrio norvegicus]MCC4799016.1 outer membrane protein assembly factor BamC [Enterovibrio norvegicus]PMI29346.1 outer membrane assembly protein BamC [Enterovibrio norvegicus]PMI37875.1 outer membrane assembly protein BamC [Enterovibrio norvegicus]PMN46464.1 outer membrane assembly protein BamC [Enterovibrio norvegicus]TKF10954.1 outer membrane protein assembly factor BamC [Enterovibrio norvegicus]
MKPVFKLGLCAVVVASLAACSSSESRRQASDDFEYLESAPLSEWQNLPDQQPEFSGAYTIPNRDFAGPTGRNIDIRPPQQILELIPGARYERDAKGVTVWMPREEQSERVWQTINTLIEENQIPVRTSSIDGVETDWLVWTLEDDDEVIESRYTVVPVSDRSRSGFRIDMIEWKRNGQAEDVSVDMRDRYSAQMTNMITSRYDGDLREEARIRAAQLVKNIPISLGKDRSGLPVIIARAPYDVFWERLPAILGQLGMTVEDRNRSQGTLTVKYKAPDDEFWEEIGTKPLQLDRDNYDIQLGDLGNRTSINVTDSAGKPIAEEQLASLSPVLVAAVERLNLN